MSTINLREELASLRLERHDRRPRSNGWLWIFLGLTLAGIVCAGGAVAWANRDRFARSIAVKTDTVRVMTVGQASTLLTATGYLESRMQAAVGAKVPGRVVDIPVEEGIQVKKGEKLAELEHSELDAMLASRRVAIELAEAELFEAENQLTQAERDYIRQQGVFERKAGTQSALENAETAFKAAQARVRSKHASVAVAKAQVDEVQEQIDNMFVFAPFDGTIISKDAEVGETIMPGGMGLASGRGSVATLADMGQLEVDTDVKEDFLSQLRRGQPAEVVVDAVTDRRYRGRLREIIPMGDRSRGIVKVKVSVLDADERLFPELSATVHFLPETSESTAGQSVKAIFIPTAALFTRNDETAVWLVENDQVRLVPVTTRGESRDDVIEVTGSLSGGETVVVSPPPQLSEGARISLSP